MLKLWGDCVVRSLFKKFCFIHCLQICSYCTVELNSVEDLDFVVALGLGIHLVVIAGTRFLIDNHLKERGKSSQFHNGYRITDAAALEAAIHVASDVRMKMEGFFSRVTSWIEMSRFNLNA